MSRDLNKYIGIMLGLLFLMTGYATSEATKAAIRLGPGPVMPGGQTFTDPKKMIMVSADHPMVHILLKSNPSTGYQWVLKDDYRFHLLRPIHSAFHAATTSMSGAPGYEVWDFKVNKKSFTVQQMTSITLEYRRPWETGAPAQSMTFMIMLEPSIH